MDPPYNLAIEVVPNAHTLEKCNSSRRPQEIFEFVLDKLKLNSFKGIECSRVKSEKRVLAFFARVIIRPKSRLKTSSAIFQDPKQLTIATSSYNGSHRLDLTISADFKGFMNTCLGTFDLLRNPLQTRNSELGTVYRSTLRPKICGKQGVKSNSRARLNTQSGNLVCKLIPLRRGSNLAQFCSRGQCV